MGVGDEIIPATSAFQRYACICGNQACTELRLAFKALGDQRSRCIQLPTPTADGRSLKPGSTDLKKKRTDRMISYLCRGEEVIATEAYDNRKASREQRQTRTRTSSNVPERSRKWVAIHHFHPSIVRLGLRKGKGGKPDTFGLPQKVSKEFIQENVSGSKGYKNDDLTPDQEFFMTVPSYTVAESQADLEALKERVDRLTLIEEHARKRAPTRARRLSTREQTHDTTLAEAHLSNKRKKTVKNSQPLIEALFVTLQEQEGELVALKASGRDSTGNDERAIHYKALTSKIAGVNRASLSSDEWHKLHSRQAKNLFGFDTWDETKETIHVNFDLQPRAPSEWNPDSPLTEFEECLLCLAWMENDITLETMKAYTGGKSITTVSNLLKKWTPEWGEVGDQMSVLPWITAEFIDEMEPEKYQKAKLRKAGSVIDGKDFGAETVRKNAVVGASQNSSKIDASAFRLLTWSMTYGLIFERTRGFLAKTSEKALNKLWGAHGRLQNIPAGYLIMGDKGFDGTSGLYPNDNAVLHPAFLYGKAFKCEQVGWNILACQLRYTCEVDFSRVTNRRSLYGKLRRCKFSYFEDLVGWAHGRANMYKPLQMPTKYKYMFE